jgi:hypothetical protein
VQALSGHSHVETTMIDTHVLNRGGRGVVSPADRLGVGDGPGRANGVQRTAEPQTGAGPLNRGGDVRPGDG